MLDEDLICVIDLGTTEIRAIIGTYNSRLNEFEIIAYSSVRSEGIKNGEIINVEALSNCIRDCISKIEDSLDITVYSSHVVVNAKNVKYVRSSSQILFYDKEGKIVEKEITEKDVMTLMDKVKEEHFESGYVLSDVFISKYEISEGGKSDEGEEVDGNMIDSPVGMSSNGLKVDFILSFMKEREYKKIIKSMEFANIEIKGIILQPVAVSTFLLSKDDREIGTLLLNMGDSSTDFVFWQGGKMKCISNLAVGGRHFTDDILIACRLSSREEAENIKVNYVHFNFDNYNSDTFTISEEEEEEKRFVKTIVVDKAVKFRADDIFDAIENKFPCPGLKKNMNLIVLSGEASKMKDFKEFISEKFGVAVKRNLHTLKGVKLLVEGGGDVIDSKFISALGGLKYVSNRKWGEMSMRKSRRLLPLENFFKKIIFWR